MKKASHPSTILLFLLWNDQVLLFEKATFVMDRGYDDNKMFLKLDSMNQDYVIRLTAKQKLLYHNKWVFATELQPQEGKGKTASVLQREAA